MHRSSKQRMRFSIAGSVLIHIFIIALLALTGLFSINKNDDRILEVAVFDGGGGGGSKFQGTVSGTNANAHEQSADKVLKHADMNDIVDKTTQEQPSESVTTNKDFQESQNISDTNGRGDGQGSGSGAGSGSGSGNGNGQGSGEGNGSGSGVGNGTDSPAVPPRLISHREPVYPSSARKAGIEGTTTVRMLVGADGDVDEVTVDGSSGSDALDAAAVSACYKWSFTPAKNGMGQPISCYIFVPISFRLSQ